MTSYHTSFDRVYFVLVVSREKKGEIGRKGEKKGEKKGKKRRERERKR